MLISDQHRFAFIHVPKTGGDAISHALRPYADGVDASQGEDKHWNARRTRDTLFGEDHGRRWGAYFSFGVIRNPWEQVHSDYHFCRQSDDPGESAGSWRFKVLRSRELSFAEFVVEICGEHGCGGVGLTQHYLCNREGQQMVTRILRHETLQAEWPAVCAAIGLPTLELPRVNVTRNRPDYRDEYDDRSRFLVGRRFADDVERFAYTFGG